jgi:threonine/homoserine/homoserine lactone efflux protein
MDPLWLFALLVLGIIVVPGMDMAFALSSALADGPGAGCAAVAGLVVGGMVHVAMGSFGVGLVLQNAPQAFNGLLAAGALYVAWMGVALWRHPATLGDVAIGPSRSRRQTFARAVVTCLLNPKAYVFMVAVFPAFIDPGGSLLRQSIVLGAIVAATQAVVYGTLVAGAAFVRSGLQRSARRQALLARAVAGLLLLTAGWTLWQGWRLG